MRDLILAKCRQSFQACHPRHSPFTQIFLQTDRRFSFPHQSLRRHLTRPTNSFRDCLPNYTTLSGISIHQQLIVKARVFIHEPNPGIRLQINQKKTKRFRLVLADGGTPRPNLGDSFQTGSRHVPCVSGRCRDGAPEQATCRTRCTHRSGMKQAARTTAA